MTAEALKGLAINQILFRRGVVAMPTRENYSEGDDWFLLRDSGQNQHKREWVPGLTLLPWLYSSNGDEFPGGAIKYMDFPNQNSDISDLYLAKQNALIREIREESGIHESAFNFLEYPKPFYALQLRPDKITSSYILTLFSVSVFHWVVSEQSENWLLHQKKARVITGNQIVKGDYGGSVRHRDQYILKRYTREQVLGEM